MKKLMFGAALAATSMVFAATPAGQVYDVTLSIKTTAAASATINSKTNPLIEEEGLTVYRKQASATWKGLIWGCDCEAIDGVWEEVTQYDDYATIKGCILWDTKTKKPVYIGNGSNLTDAESAQDCGFGWDFLNAIDKNGKKVEGAWTMVQDGKACADTDNEFEGTLLEFKGAGFGTLNLGDDCTSYVKSISGNFAGWMKAPYASTKDDWSGCTFCGYDPIYGECEFATAWNYCECDDYLDVEKTAAYGTWKVAYNGTLSKRLSTKATSVDSTGAVTIRMAYNFKNLPYVSAAILAIENTFWGIDPTGCDDLEAALAEANTALKEAKDALEDVSDENLANAYYAAAEAASVSRTNAAAYAATTNLFGVSDFAMFKYYNGLQLASKAVLDPITREAVEYVFDWDTTLEYNYNEYWSSLGGTTNAVLAAKAVADEAWDAVNTNRYVITISDATETTMVTNYGSKAAAAYIAAQYTKTSVNAAILIEAYEDAEGTTPDATRTTSAQFTDKGIVEKYNAYATADAAALVKANTALETAQEANATATATFKTLCENAWDAQQAEGTALSNYEYRKILQAAAQKEVDAAQEAYDKAEKALEDAGCNE